MINFSSKSLPELNKYAKPIALVFEELFFYDKISSYGLIRIIQWPVGEEATDVATIVGKDKAISIAYDLPKNAADLDDKGKYELVLDIVCQGLFALVEADGKLTKQWVENARQTVVNMGFSFWIEYQRFENKKDKGLTASLVVHAVMARYEIYLQITRDGKKERPLPLLESNANLLVLNELFSIGKWRTKDLFVLTGKQSEIEVQYTASTGMLDFVNVSSAAPRSPYFDMFRLRDSEKGNPEETKKALDDYLNAAYPGLADIFNATISGSHKKDQE